MAKKTSELFDPSHEYTCLACGKSWDNPNGHFYKSPWSNCFVANSKYVHLCKTCCQKMFDSYEKKYDTMTACIIMCYKLDVPFYYTLYNTFIQKNNKFTMGMYLRVLNNKQYQYQDFSQTLLTHELNKTEDEIRDAIELKWNADEIEGKTMCIDIIGYDPFEKYPENDRKILFQELVKYLDEDGIEDDTYKISQIVQLINNNYQITTLDLSIAKIDPLKDSATLKALQGMKNGLVACNDKIAKENEISVRNRSDKEAGRSTLTYLMKDLREKDFYKIEENYYNQLRSPGSRWATDISFKSLKANCFFDENDTNTIIEEQRDMIVKLQEELDQTAEEKRLLSLELLDYKNKMQNQEEEDGE